MQKPILFFLALSISLVSCQKEGADLLRFFEYNANGETIRVENYDTFASDMGENVTITLRENSNSAEVYIILNDYRGEGTYENVFINYQPANSSTTYYCEGTVTLNTVSQKGEYFEGTFNASGATLGGQPMNLTDGDFRLNFLDL